MVIIMAAYFFFNNGQTDLTYSIVKTGDAHGLDT
jgi:hypothetical protein